MWLIPSNLPLSFPFAPEYLDLKEGLKELECGAVSLPTLKSKRLLLQTLLLAWKRVYWFRHLCGRMLKPSTHTLFVERYTASLEDIHVSPSASLGSKTGLTMSSTFGQIYMIQLELFSQDSATLKTLLTTSTLGTNRSKGIWRDWVIGLRREYTQRLKLALHTREKDYLSLLWTTPSARDYKDTPGMSMSRGSQERGRLDQLGRQVFFHAKEAYSSGIGRNPELIGGMNPAWVAQLMGTTLERTFFVPLVTQLWSKQQN